MGTSSVATSSLPQPLGAAPQRTASDAGPGAPPATVWGVLRQLAVNPADFFVRCWNWKSAVLSSLVRGQLFFFVNLSAGFGQAFGAMAAEMLYRAALAGFFGSLTQSFRRVRPAWHGTVAVMLLLPLANHTVEFIIHWMRGTPKLFASIGFSVLLSIISSLFHYYVMRRGLLVVGEGGGSLASDFKRLPLATLGFIGVPFVALWRLAKRLRSQRAAVPMTADASSAD